MRIVILIRERATGRELGVIFFEPDGMLITRAFEGGVHVRALGAVVKAMEGLGLDVPLYRKYAEELKAAPALPADILEREAAHYAEALNRLDPPLELGGVEIKAEVGRLRD